MKLYAAVVCYLLAVAAGSTLPPMPCVCTMEYMPVCGMDGITYGNKCARNCAGVEEAYTGECHKVCACPRNLDPVCGQDGKTYSNMCEMNCAGIAFFQNGACVTASKRASPCICTFIYMPVCGSDGITYGNECGLNCVKEEKGISKLSDGECPTTTTNSPIF